MNFLRTMMEYITPTPTSAFVSEDGRLFSPTGQLIHKYARKRDAIRGAKRRGWEVEVA